MMLVFVERNNVFGGLFKRYFRLRKISLAPLLRLG